jgi:hypothetical protein
MGSQRDGLHRYETETPFLTPQQRVPTTAQCFPSRDARRQRTTHIGVLILCLLLAGCARERAAGFAEGFAQGLNVTYLLQQPMAPAPPAQKLPAQQPQQGVVSKATVIQELGRPQAITGTEEDTYWWYRVSDAEIYALRFVNHVLVKMIQTNADEIRRARAVTQRSRSPLY